MSSTMYALKPTISDFHIELPTCMYSLKPVNSHKKCSASSFSVCGAKKLPVMDELEVRQQNIIKQLEELQQQIQLMNKDLNVCNKPAQPSSAKSSAQTSVKQQVINQKYLQDIVINSTPNNVPYSLLALKNLWQNRLLINIQCFTHSTVLQLSPEAQKLGDAIATQNNANEKLPQLNVSLIWKDVGINAQLNSSTTMYVPIVGEVNIIRYLSRIGPNEFNYENAGNVNEIDTLLDLCYQFKNETNLKNRQNIVRSITSRLTTEFYGGAQISIADIAVYSAIKQSSQDVTKSLPANFNKWLQKITQTIGI